MIRKSLQALGFVLAGVMVVACQPAAETPPPAGPQPTGQAGLANPASTYCADQGYTSEIRADESGAETGYCIFPDGTECEEWAFFRGECGQHLSYCAKNGGEIQTSDSGAMCVFPDGSSCPEYEFFTGECKPGGG